MSVLAVDQQLQPVPDRHVIVGQQDAERGGRMSRMFVSCRRWRARSVAASIVVPAPGVDSICSCGADERRTFVHAQQSEAALAVGRLLVLESDAVVFDDQQHASPPGARG